MKFKCKKCDFQSNKQLKECPECGGDIKKGSGCFFKLFMAFIILNVFMIGIGIVAQYQETSEFKANIDKKYSNMKSSLDEGNFSKAQSLLKEFEKFNQVDFKDVAQYPKKISIGILLKSLASTKKENTKQHVTIYSALLKLDSKNEFFLKSYKIYSDKLKVETIQKLNNDLKELNESEFKKLVRIYTKLIKLEPENQAHKDNLKVFQTKLNIKNIDSLKQKISEGEKAVKILSDHSPKKISVGVYNETIKYYQDLMKLEPNDSYTKRIAELRQFKKDRVLLEKKRVKEKLEKSEKAKKVKELIAKQFSAWDGSHKKTADYVKEQMNDPDSYKHVKTTYRELGDKIRVYLTFRGKNAFGGVVKQTIMTETNVDGTGFKVINIK